MVSTTHMYNRAKRDGTVWAIQSSSQMGQQLLGDPKPNYDVSQMPHIFSVSGSAAAIVRDFLGARKGKDITKVDPSKIVVSGLGLLTVTFLSDIVGLDLMGIKGYKYVVGYPSTSQTTLAFASGEVSYVGGTGLHHVLGKSGLYYEQIQKGTAVVLWQTGRMSSQGKVVRSPGTEIPTFAEIYQQVHGKPPSGPEWEAYKLTGPIMRTLNRSLVLPPGVPKDRVAQLRGALKELYANPKFIKEWEKIFGLQLDFIPGEDANRSLKSMMGTSPGWDYLKGTFIPKLKAKK